MHGGGLSEKDPNSCAFVPLGRLVATCLGRVEDKKGYTKWKGVLQRWGDWGVCKELQRTLLVLPFQSWEGVEGIVCMP